MAIGSHQPTSWPAGLVGDSPHPPNIRKETPPGNTAPWGLAKTRALGEFSTNDFRHHSFSFFGNSSQVRALLVPCMRACVAELLKACPHVPPTPRESARAQMVPPFPFIFSLNPIIIYNYIHKIACIKLYKAKTLYAKIKTDLYYKKVKYLYNKLM